ncbi:toxic anion resistance protein [Alkalilimnicola sp. S0819]|uniref:toxic anion resistance protein n=1 Tax=Alkalilimnicola sp. S0819 TaxID=2613922 RepID=UPI001261B585|nr:toxic anion resistance protein [Alkalilimnicola sp. S0819]KAB7627675.1 toxic anion resistance protein [Alkalilimnicola sp. S0819]MPQ15842.1 toxic anion resistance protein [Alkalilimnicola sp. S0819]
MSKQAEQGSGSGLSLPPVADLERELSQADQTPVEDPQLAAQADTFVEQVLAGGDEDAQRHRESVDGMGIEIQRQAAHRSDMLQTPIRQLARQGEEGGPIAGALLQLREQMQGLDPGRQKLSGGGLSRALALLPGVSSPLQRYFHKFETAQQTVDNIIQDLEGGREMLRRDNITLADDQQALREVIAQLRRQIALGRMIDRRFAQRLTDLPAGSPRRGFIEEELLFPLRQRVVDLQQQLAVSQQGVLALEVVIRNNRELMRGVDRALNVTVSALNVAVAVAMALANQRLVLDRVQALNSSTSEMIAGTSRALRQQGVEIQTRASGTVLDMEQLEQAFGDVMGAIDELSRYRREALPRLDEQIGRLEELGAQGDAAIRRLDEGNAAQPAS